MRLSITPAVALTIIGGFLLSACAPPQSAETASASDPKSEATATALAGSLFRGEWRQGFTYQITFPDNLDTGTAEVFVIDSDSARTEYRMPSRVQVEGTAVEMRFTKLNRVDHLTYDAEADRLTGLTEFKGKRKSSNHIWAKRAE